MLAALVALAEQARPAEAAFPGANGKIAFASYRDGNSEIYKMNADSSNQTCSVLPPCSPGPATR